MFTPFKSSKIEKIKPGEVEVEVFFSNSSKPFIFAFKENQD